MKMKKTMKKLCTLLLVVSAGLTTMAQTEISGILDADPTNGITQNSRQEYNSPGAAATACRDLVHDGHGDWYLPSVEEAMLFTIDGRDAAYQTTSMPGCTGANCAEAHYYFWTRSVEAYGSDHQKMYTGISGIAVIINIGHVEQVAYPSPTQNSRDLANAVATNVYGSAYDGNYVRCVR